MSTLSTISAPAVVALTAPAPAITIDVIGLSASQGTPVSDKKGGRHSKGVSRSNSTVQDDSTKIHLVWQVCAVQFQYSFQSRTNLERSSGACVLHNPRLANPTAC